MVCRKTAQRELQLQVGRRLPHRVPSVRFSSLERPFHQAYHRVDDQSDEKDREDYAKGPFHLSSMNLPRCISDGARRQR
jgi:hypothetical protein